MIRSLFRWVFTFGLIVTTLASGQGRIPCANSATDAVSSDDELPECCREGFCPHHAHQEAAKARAAARSEKDDCICRMSSQDSQAFAVLAPTVAVLDSTEAGLVELHSTGSTSARDILCLVSPDLPLFTPPPRA